MQVVFRGLLAVTLSGWLASCSLDSHGLGAADGGRPGGGAAGSAQGSAGSLGTAGVTGTPGLGGAPAETGAGGAVGSPPDTGSGGGAAGEPGAGGAAGDGALGGAGGITATGGAAGGTDPAGGAGGGPAGGAGGSIVFPAGCSDGSREGFLDASKYPKIAACAGGWEDPGLTTPDSFIPQCNRHGGNDGQLPDGHGCSAIDLCAAGWRVCESAHAVAARATGCQDAIAPAGSDPVFYATRQRNNGLTCDLTSQSGANNLYGCGNIGSTADKSCAPFTRMLRDADCKNQSPWLCSDGPLGTSVTELDVATKRGVSRGGVLCCYE